MQVASYARCLNDKKHIGSLKEYNELVASVAEISAEMEVEKKRKRDEAASKLKAQQEKREQAAKEFETIQEVKMPELREFMKDRSAASDALHSTVSIKDSLKSHLMTLSRRQLTDLLK